jgi:hypothetical protein
VLLQIRRGHIRVELALDGTAHDRRLVLAGGDERDLACLHDRGDAHRYRLGRDVVFSEEVAGRITPRHGVERDSPRARIHS